MKTKNTLTHIHTNHPNNNKTRKKKEKNENKKYLSPYTNPQNNKKPKPLIVEVE